MPLSFKQAGNTFIAGPNINIYPSGNTYAISGSGGGGSGTIISGINIGTGIGVFQGLQTTTNPNDTLGFYNLLQGDNVGIITNDNGEIVINRGRTVVNTVSNQGGGAKIYTGITGTTLFARTISGSVGFTSALANTGNAATDSDATAFITAASITSTTQITAISNLVFDLKQNNLWDKMYAIYPFVGGTSVDNHKYNLKDPRDLDAAYRLVFSGSWTFNNGGISATTLATTNFVNTFFNPFSSSSVSQDSVHISVYLPTALDNTTCIMGVVSSTTPNQATPALQIIRSTNHGATVNARNSDNLMTIGGPSISGHMIGNRTSSTVANTWLNGTKITTSAAPSLTPPNFNIYLGVRNSANTPAVPSNRQMRFASIGSGLTDTEAAIFSTIVESYQTTLSRQVIASTIRGVNTVVRIAPTNTTANFFYFSNASNIMTVGGNFPFNSTVGTIAIAAAASTTTRLLLPATTASISQIRLTPFSTEPTSPSDGSIWFSTSGNILKFQKDTITTDFLFNNTNNISLTGETGTPSRILYVDSAGTFTTIDYTINKPRYINSFCPFNTISSVTISNTTSETSTISPVLSGSTTLLASNNIYNPELVVGRKYRFSARGILGSDVTPVNLNIRIKLGSTIISSSSTISIGLGDSISLEFDIESTFTVRNSGLIVGSGKIIFSAPPSDFGGDPVIFGIYSQNATIDTASDKVFDCTAQFDVADPTNFITIYESTLEILN
jgi:hypothetical protein